ncbi:phosphatase PAP2 family protein [Adhaeribacter soli]|uniref:Phosphatase PAP2 family protein n=1 Tax=Adhaeribacter soli TaxID=2607655 RepID=A0A5N1J2Q3_9BACT|nr:phosphatase PAP2 family protein [Adhaeribacter soli]KAA9341028.1 phosphatase PAP2 family protein [Adhaeribacter soli]
MKKQLIAFLLLFQITGSAFSQNNFPSPYETKPGRDLGITLAGIAGTGIGLYLIANKDKLSEAEIAALDKNDVNKFDRFAAGNYNTNAKALSDIPFYGSFVVPLALLADKEVFNNGGQVYLLYAQTMAITGAAYALTIGLTDRYRPLAYKNDDPLNQDLQEDRRSKNARNSFYAGHTAAAASACFFTAKVFHDFNPDSKWRPVVWGAAAAVPVVVGYARLKAGKHFLSDNIVGYAVGTSIGILVPHLHKTGAMDGVSILPVIGPYNGVAATVAF